MLDWLVIGIFVFSQNISLSLPATSFQLFFRISASLEWLANVGQLWRYVSKKTQLWIKYFPLSVVHEAIFLRHIFPPNQCFPPNNLQVEKPLLKLGKVSGCLRKYIDFCVANNYQIDYQCFQIIKPCASLDILLIHTLWTTHFHFCCLLLNRYTEQLLALIIFIFNIQNFL